MNRALWLIVLLPVSAVAVTFGNSKYQGLFGSGQSSTTFGNSPPAGTGRTGSEAPRGEGENVPAAMKDYGVNLSKLDAAALVRLQKAAKQSGTSLGTITTREHVALSNCLFPADNAPDTTPTMAAQCLDRASQASNRELLALRFPQSVGTSQTPPAKPSPH